MNKILAVHVKPGAKKTEILSKGEVWEIAVAAPADKDKANSTIVLSSPSKLVRNKELVRFLSKELKKKVRIKSGLKSKEKLLILE